MFVTFVHVWVLPGHIEAFIKASVENHEFSIKESGNLRFDILQDKNDPAKFVLYEAYESEEASAEHKKTAHYFKWREAVAEMMAKPREGVAYNIIAPTDKDLW